MQFYHSQQEGTEWKGHQILTQRYVAPPVERVGVRFTSLPDGREND
jgi:hypothetical protein